MYQDQRKYQQAEPLLRRATVIRELRFGSAHPITATTPGNLAFRITTMARLDTRR